jgi:hypothetical protein
MSMTTQTVTTERQEIIQIIDTLSDDAIGKLAPYVAFLRYEDETPNAETAAVISSALSTNARNGKTRQEFFDAMHSDD